MVVGRQLTKKHLGRGRITGGVHTVSGLQQVSIDNILYMADKFHRSSLAISLTDGSCTCFNCMFVRMTSSLDYFGRFPGAQVSFKILKMNILSTQVKTLRRN